LKDTKDKLEKAITNYGWRAELARQWRYDKKNPLRMIRDAISAWRQLHIINKYYFTFSILFVSTWKILEILEAAMSFFKRRLSSRPRPAVLLFHSPG
jgi:hypothetical protein